MEEEKEEETSPSITTPLLLRQWWRNHFPIHPWTTSLHLKTSFWSELGGSVDDLGTYIHIVIALTLVSHFDITLIFTALYKIITGLLFDIPMPVQSMKSIAAVAISESPSLTLPQIVAAGISTDSISYSSAPPAPRTASSPFP